MSRRSAPAAAPEAKDSKADDSVAYWLAVAKKVETSDEDGTEKLLLEKSLEELREDTKKLDDTRWMFEDMPADPDAIEASVGL
mmetsp:Transcript_5670/g.17901  ORF Transcript_5670/g.17901 Transcript_5670/m.17901 type:complete len:83 (+) Transcript_5670:1081-1329(+)